MRGWTECRDAEQSFVARVCVDLVAPATAAGVLAPACERCGTRCSSRPVTGRARRVLSPSQTVHVRNIRSDRLERDPRFDFDFNRDLAIATVRPHGAGSLARKRLQARIIVR